MGMKFFTAVLSENYRLPFARPGSINREFMRRFGRIFLRLPSFGADAVTSSRYKLRNKPFDCLRGKLSDLNIVAAAAADAGGVSN